MLNDIPRGVEVLVKKAAVDPAFKKLLFEKRAEAAEAIALTLSPAEEAMLEAVPEDQLRAIIGNTKVSPRLRPAFLGYAAAAMLAALAARAPAHGCDDIEYKTYGLVPDTAPETAATAETNDRADYGLVSGMVTDEKWHALGNVEVIIKGTGLTVRTDKEGYYVFPSVPKGLYDMEVRHDEFGVQTKTGVKVLPGLRTIVSFHFGNNYEHYPEYEWEMRTTGVDAETPPKAETAATAEKNAATEYGMVSGLVMRVDGQPFENVEVIIVGTGLTARTNKDGYYQISPVPEGTYEVKVSHDELDTQSKTDVPVIKGMRTTVPFYLGYWEHFPVSEKRGITYGIRPDLP